MPTTVTLSTFHKHRQPSQVLMDRFAEQGRCVTDQFVACKTGGMLLNKLLGFIDDERAEVLNISESQATLRLGRPLLGRLADWSERRRPVEVKISFAEPGEDLTQWKRANTRRSVVDVQLRPLTWRLSTKNFHRRAESIVHNLRQHFVAD
jgi:hypothetical protein